MQIKEESQNMSNVLAAAFHRFHFMDSHLQMKQTFYISPFDHVNGKAHLCDTV